MSKQTPGAAFRLAVQEESPLQVVGAINANHALLAKRAGFRAIYLSGGGVAAGSLGLPDLGISNLDDVLTDVRRITDVCDLPLLVDVDTGFGASAFNVARTVRARRSSASRRWSTASRPPSTRAPTTASSSWRAPTRWPSKAWKRRWNAPSPASKRAPT